MDILEASGAFDPGSNPGRGVPFFDQKRLLVVNTEAGKNIFTFMCTFNIIGTNPNILSGLFNLLNKEILYV